MVRPIAESARGFLRRPMNAILGAPSHVAVLRALKDTAAGATGREIAQAAGVANQAALDALGRLETAGIVRRRTAGRAYLFQINREHHLVVNGLLPLLNAESTYRTAIEKSLHDALRKDVLAAAIFGSKARGDDSPSSDLDVCLIVRRIPDKERALARCAACADRFEREFGVRFAPLAFGRDELRRLYRRGDSLVREIVGDARSFLGPQLEELVRG